MTAYLTSKGKTLYLDLPIDSPMAQVAGHWFGRPLVYGPFGKERIMLIIKGRMPPLTPPTPRPEARNKEEALEGIREMDWEGFKRGLAPRGDSP